MKRSRVLLLAVPLLLAALPGCPAWTSVCKTIGLCERRLQVLPPVMPEDFQIVLKVEGQSDPASDYLVTLRRNGTGEYRVTQRKPVRQEKSGKITVEEGKLQDIYAAVVEVGYDTLPERIPEEGDGPLKSAGIQAFNVNVDDYPKEVQLVFASHPGLEKIRTLVLSAIPDEANQIAKPNASRTTSSLEVVGDTKTMRFYAPDSPLLKDVPADRRQTFPTYYEAINYQFAPAPDWRAPTGQEK